MSDLTITVSKAYYESVINKRMNVRHYPAKTREEAIQYIKKFYPWIKCVEFSEK
jgi:hypothetical protein